MLDLASARINVALPVDDDLDSTVFAESERITVANAGGEVQKALEPANMVTLVAAVSSETDEWVKDVKAAVAPTLTKESRASFEADIGRLDAMSALFQDAPDDLLELL